MSLQLEARISESMRRLNMTTEFIAILVSLYGITGMSQPRISQALRGAKPFDNVKGQQLYDLIQEIQELCDSSDVPVSLTNPAIIKERLDARRQIKTAIKFDSDNLRKFLEVSDDNASTTDN